MITRARIVPLLVGAALLGAALPGASVAAPRRASVTWPQGSAAFALKGLAVQALARTGAHGLLAGTPKGMYRSTDGGKTWHRNGPAGDVTVLAADPTSQASRKVYAGVDGAILRTTDSGGTWTALPRAGSTSTPPTLVTAIAAHGSTVAIGDDQGLFVSHDAGQTWSGGPLDQFGSLVTSLFISGSTIYLSGETVGFGEIVNGRGPYYANDGLPANGFVGDQPTSWPVTSVLAGSGAHGEVTVLACGGGTSYALEPSQIGTYQWQLSGYVIPSGDKVVSCGPFNLQPIGHHEYAVANRVAVGFCTDDGSCSPLGYSHAKVAILSVALGDPAKKGGARRLLLGTAKGLQWFTLRKGV
ncbi:MAG TPA: YCF48-related protein [Mycobacteriales bacterium]|nr:YCF48-related protein [Mycobacteriales bacterium]